MTRRGTGMADRAIVRAGLAFALLAAAGWALLAQEKAGLRFEVASIRPTDFQTSNAENQSFAEYRAGKRTSFCDPCISGLHYDVYGMALKVLIGDAYRIDPRLIAGPAWLNDADATLFTIRALMPAVATKEQIPEMMKALLEERFHLAVRHGTAQQTGYELVVGKNGPKLKPPRALDRSLCEPWVKSTIALRDGSVSEICRMTKEEGDRVVNTMMNTDSALGPLLSSTSRGETFESHIEYFSITIRQLTDYLTRSLSTATMGGSIVQVTNRTGIEGSWDVVLDESSGDMRLPTVSSSLEKLGLRLERTTVQVDTLIVDRVDKVPTEN